MHKKCLSVHSIVFVTHKISLHHEHLFYNIYKLSNTHCVFSTVTLEDDCGRYLEMLFINYRLFTYHNFINKESLIFLKYENILNKFVSE